MKSLFVLVIAYIISIVFLKFHIYSFGLLFVLIIAGAILLNAKIYILFWLICAAISNKVTVPGFGMTSYGMMNIFFLPVLTFKVFKDCRKEFLDFPIRNAYLIFLVLVFISIWYSPVSYVTSIRSYCSLVIPFLFCLLMINTLKDEKMIKLYVKVTLISSAMLAILSTVMYSLGKWVVFLNVPRAIGVLGWPNDYALFLCLNFSVSVSLAIFLKNKKERLLFLLISVILFIAVIPTFSKGGYAIFIAAIVITSVLACLKKKNIWPLLIIAILVALCGSVAIIKYSDIISQRWINTSSYDTRVTIWNSVLPKFYEHPIIGSGTGSSKTMVKYMSPYSGLTSTHNLFLLVLLEYGLIGIVAFIYVYLSIIRFAFVNYFYQQNPHVVGLSVGLIVLVLAGLIYSWGGNSFLTPMTNLYVWFYLGFLVSISRLKY